MSRGYGKVQLFILDALKEHRALSYYDLALLRWPDDHDEDGKPYQQHVESVRRAADGLAYEDLIRILGWDEQRTLYRSPVKYQPKNSVLVIALRS